jgi:hypothetical protein
VAHHGGRHCRLASSSSGPAMGGGGARIDQERRCRCQTYWYMRIQRSCNLQYELIVLKRLAASRADESLGSISSTASCTDWRARCVALCCILCEPTQSPRTIEALLSSSKPAINMSKHQSNLAVACLVP